MTELDQPPPRPPALAPAPRPPLDAHRGMLRRYLFVLGARPDRLDDLVQGAFVVALQKGVEDRGPGPVGAFLRSIAKHLLLRERRSAASRREVELADEVWRHECGGGGGDERLDALRRCIAELPARSLALLEATYRDGAGRDELGAAFGLSADGVKTALRRLRTALRACVERRLRGAS